MENIAALIFIGCCIFIPMILTTWAVRPSVVEVVRYRENVPTTVYNVEPAKFVQSTIVFNDAVDALMSLGMKKTIAKEKITEMFKYKRYDSLESLLMDVYKK